MELGKRWAALARTWAIVLALANEPGGCASCGAPPPDPEPPRSDPLPAPDLHPAP